MRGAQASRFSPPCSRPRCRAAPASRRTVPSPPRVRSRRARPRSSSVPLHSTGVTRGRRPRVPAGGRGLRQGPSGGSRVPRPRQRVAPGGTGPRRGGRLDLRPGGGDQRRTGHAPDPGVVAHREGGPLRALRRRLERARGRHDDTGAHHRHGPGPGRPGRDLHPGHRGRREEGRHPAARRPPRGLAHHRPAGRAHADHGRVPERVPVGPPVLPRRERHRPRARPALVPRARRAVLDGRSRHRGVVGGAGGVDWGMRS